MQLSAAAEDLGSALTVDLTLALFGEALLFDCDKNYHKSHHAVMVPGNKCQPSESRGAVSTGWDQGLAALRGIKTISSSEVALFQTTSLHFCSGLSSGYRNCVFLQPRRTPPQAFQILR